MKYINNWNYNDFDQSLRNIDCNDLGYVNKFAAAGDGNMNYTIRLFFDKGKTLVAKQSPSFCAKFPNIPAPKERIHSERMYFSLINNDEKLKEFSPKIIGFDEVNEVLYLEDLGEGVDFEDIYSKRELHEDELNKIISYLSSLHSNVECPNFMNLEMRKLNFNYIFNLPLREDAKDIIDLDEITPGLNDIRASLITNRAVKSKLSDLGDIYMKDCRHLIHGDYYPKSWLQTEKGFFVIDSEFGFKGRAEFDLGVLLAHLAFSENYNLYHEEIKNLYHGPKEFDWSLAYGFCASEIMRRLLYVAQLPLKNNLEFKRSLIETSILFLEGKSESLIFK